MEAAFRRVGATDISSHNLRKTFATHLLSRCAAITDVQHLLGRASVKTTERAYAASVKNGRFKRTIELLDEPKQPRLTVETSYPGFPSLATMAANSRLTSLLKKIKHYELSGRIAKMDLATTMDEVVQQFTTKLRVAASISVGIHSNSKETFAEEMQHTNKEDSNVLRFSNVVFE